MAGASRKRPRRDPLPTGAFFCPHNASANPRRCNRPSASTAHRCPSSALGLMFADAVHKDRDLGRAAHGICCRHHRQDRIVSGVGESFKKKTLGQAGQISQPSNIRLPIGGPCPVPFGLALAAALLQRLKLVQQSVLLGSRHYHLSRPKCLSSSRFFFAFFLPLYCFLTAGVRKEQRSRR